MTLPPFYKEGLLKTLFDFLTEEYMLQEWPLKERESILSSSREASFKKRDKSFYILAENNLTLKTPNKNCSRRRFYFLLLCFKENKACFFT